MAKKQWYAECTAVQGAVRRAVQSLHVDGRMADTARHQYFMSVTEQEIQKGLMSTNNPTGQILCFFRKLTGLTSDRLQDKDATRFIDTTVTNNRKETIDDEVADLRNNLHDNKIPQKLAASEITRYMIPWSEGGISPDTEPQHKIYINKLCTDFIFGVTKSIEKAKHLADNVIPVSEYYTTFNELLHHMHFCNVKCAGFKGQEKILNDIKAYLSVKKNRSPLTIYAESGVGKTSVMAMVMKMLPEWFGNSCIRLIRFLGTSPDSTNIHDVLFNVAGQLADHFDMIMEPVGYKSMKSLIKYFPRFLRNVSRASKEPVFILLDSIDQLSASDDAFSMNWLPTELPQNVHIILSMLPKTHGCLENTKKQVKVSDAFIELKTLDDHTAKDLIDSYLRKHNRKFQDIDSILRMCHEKMAGEGIRPLVLKVILDKAVKWPSYNEKSNIAHYTSLKGDVVSELFAGLENKYGKIIISRALGYLTCGLNGLTEVELEDVLSLDDEVLDNVYAYHNPPVEGVVRVPVLLWRRIHFDLKEYLTERLSQGKNTVFWYHRQFIEGAQKRYCRPEDLKVLHMNLAKMYLSEHGMKKTIKLSKRKLIIENADRQLSLQPLTPKNKRMLQALPYHLKMAGDEDMLKKHVLCNLRFIMNKVKAFSLTTLIKDYATDEEFDDVEINNIKCCLSDMKHTLNAENIPVEITARLPIDTASQPMVSALVKSCWDYLKTNDKPSLLPLYPCLGDASEVILSLSDCVDVCSVSSDLLQAIVEVKENPETNTEWKHFDSSMSSEIKLLSNASLSVPPVFSDNFKQIWSFKPKSSKKSSFLSTFFDIAKPKKVYQLEFQPNGDLLANSKLIKANISGKFITIAFSDLQFHTFELPQKVAKLEEGITLPTHHQFTLDLPDKEHLQMLRSLSFDNKVVYLLTSKKIEDVSAIAIHNYESKATGCIEIAGSILAKLAYLSDEGTNLLNVPYLQNKNKLTLATIDVEKVEVVESKEISVLELSQEDILCLSSESVSVVQHTAEAFEINFFNKDGAKQSSVPVTPGVTPQCVSSFNEYTLLGDQQGLIHVYSGQSYLGYKSVLPGIPMKMISFNSNAGNVIIHGENGDLHVCKIDTLLKSLDQAGKHSNPLQLENHGLAIAFAVVEQQKAIATLDKDCKLRVWDIKGKRLSKEIILEKDEFIRGGEILSPSRKAGICCILLLKSNAFYAVDIQKGQIICKRDAISFCYNLMKAEMLVLEKIENKHVLHTLSWPDFQLKSSKEIKGTIIGLTVRMRTNDNGNLAILGVECTPKELDIILTTEKKNHLVESFGTTKFCAIDLQSEEANLKICYRQLTKIPCLGVSWEIYEDNMVLIGRNRTVLIWDVVSDICDQRLIKGTKVAIAYRPEYIEDLQKNYQKICFGKTESMHRSQAGDTLAVGSEDGFVMAYSISKGYNFVPKMGTKPNHGGHVKRVAVTPDGKFIASYCAAGVLKVWDVYAGLRQVSCIGLGLDLDQMNFSPDSKNLVMLGTKTNGARRVFLFELLVPDKKLI